MAGWVSKRSNNGQGFKARRILSREAEGALDSRVGGVGQLGESSWITSLGGLVELTLFSKSRSIPAASGFTTEHARHAAERENPVNQT
mmetsp:Transcript_36266/g.83642  ORF Transcript_36266/g.83642 Transcript_36266/m.83642 type:complete len:88 (+) Transcript_36266:380-643(+)